jgi:hypothetical protein
MLPPLLLSIPIHISRYILAHIHQYFLHPLLFIYIYIPSPIHKLENGTLKKKVRDHYKQKPTE